MRPTLNLVALGRSQLQATALALVAAGIAALAFALVSLLWFVVGVVVSGALALIAEVVARRGARRTKREDAAQAHAARLAELTGKADVLKARERAIERAQMEVRGVPSGARSLI